MDAVVAALRLSDGRIAVVSRRAAQIKFFAPDGRHARPAGRSGYPESRRPLPPGLYPMEIGVDHVLGLSRDAYGVETVRLHALSREAAGSPGVSG